MAKMYELLSSATKQKIGVEIRKNNIYFFYEKEILAKQALVEPIENKQELWVAETYNGDDVVETFDGTKEIVAQRCIQYALKKKVEMDNDKRFGKQPRPF